MDNIFTLLVAIVAIISPVVTTILNHRFALKMAQIKTEERKQEIISCFLSELSYIAHISPHKFEGLSKDALKVVRYLPESYSSILFVFMAELDDRHHNIHPDSDVTFSNLSFDNQKIKIPNYGDFLKYSQIVNFFVSALTKQDVS